MKTITVFALLAVLLPAFSAAQTANVPTPASQATPPQPPRLQRWFVSADLRKTPNANKLKAAAEEAVANCYLKAVDITALASGDRESSRRNGSYAADRERAAIEAIKAAGGDPLTAQSRYTGVGDPHGRGVQIQCAYPAPGPQGPAGQNGASGYDGANCYDGLADLNGDGDIDVEDCRVPSSNGVDFRVTIGAGLITDLLGEYNRLDLGLFLNPVWQADSFVMRVVLAGGFGNADKFTDHTVEGLLVVAPGAEITDGIELGVGPTLSGVYGQEDRLGVYNREVRFGVAGVFTSRWGSFELTVGAGPVKEYDQGTGHDGFGFQGFLTGGYVIGADK